MTKLSYASVGIDLFQRMFQVGEDCEVMIRVDEDSEEEDFQLVSGILARVPSLSQVLTQN